MTAAWGTEQRPWQIPPYRCWDSWVYYRDNPEALTPEQFLARTGPHRAEGGQPAIIGGAFHAGNRGRR